ncbi:hypothetical protein H4W80_002023 [Nonomuraea angiospora]|uniref:FAD-binding domain-containing protein n=1 Tax=Nonomuraea angiospora TaxID=46172 RepID=A0ABR9LTZ1_9ACTN|nr:FAD-dependent monooxygenase [Nonomuraea angiospora]MBE1583765.1 hypothetical protein [Nonomuraea angiospora]
MRRRAQRGADDGAALLPPYGDGWFRATIWDRTRQGVPVEKPVDIDEVRDALLRITGRDLGVAEMRWSTRFLSERRQAGEYRVGRVFLAGDAAHVHSPLGAMGMSTGIQDAADLSWKLIAADRGWAPPWLLDTYQSERHPVGQTVLRLTDTLRRVVEAPAPVRAIRPYVFPRVVNHPRVSEAARLTLSGLGIAYPVPAEVTESPLAGTRVPDLPLLLDGRTSRLYEHLGDGRCVLLDTAASLPAEQRSRASPSAATRPPPSGASPPRPTSTQRWSCSSSATRTGCSTPPCGSTRRPGPC